MKRRVDAVANYNKLLVAAQEVFAAHGSGAPLALVTKKADVGRGTLYRHFPNRVALVAAIFELRISNQESYLTERLNDPQVLIGLLELSIQEQFHLSGLFRILEAEFDGNTQIAQLWERVVQTYSTALEISQAAGAVRAELQAEDIMLCLYMISAAAASPPFIGNREELKKRVLANVRRMVEVP